MKFYPRNKYIYVKQLEENKVEDEIHSGFMLPPGYKQERSALKLVEVINTSADSGVKNIYDGQKILVPENMIEKIQYKDLHISIIPEHAVYGIIIEDDSV